MTNGLERDERSAEHKLPSINRTRRQISFNHNLPLLLELEDLHHVLHFQDHIEGEQEQLNVEAPPFTFISRGFTEGGIAELTH